MPLVIGERGNPQFGACNRIQARSLALGPFELMHLPRNASKMSLFVARRRSTHPAALDLGWDSETSSSLLLTVNMPHMPFNTTCAISQIGTEG